MRTMRADAGGPLARTLRLSFPLLSFEPAIERDFLEQHWDSVQPRVHFAMYIALLTLVGFAVMDRWLLRMDRGSGAALIQFGVQLPLLLLALRHSTRAAFKKRFVPLAPAAMLVFGLGSAFLMIRASGVLGAMLGARLVLVIFFSYFLLGLSFRAAAHANAILLVGYVGVAVATHAYAEMAVYQGFVLACANLFAGAGCYALEHANRLAFLERRRLTEVATHDGLTGLLNRAAFEHEVRRLWDQAARERLPVAIVMVDIDHFKAFNDCYGHPAGDDCLRRVAGAVRTAASRRPLDFVARYGGEELIAVLYGADLEFAERAGRAAVDAVSRLHIAHAASPTQPYVTASVGATSFVPGSAADGSHQLAVRRADQALYCAKAEGRDRCRLLGREEPQDGLAAAPAAEAAETAETAEAAEAAETVGALGEPGRSVGAGVILLDPAMRDWRLIEPVRRAS